MSQELEQEIAEEQEVPAQEEESQEEGETEATEDDPDEGYDFGSGVKFKTQKEAMAYQQELLRQKDLELAEANAYRQAAQDFRTPQQQFVPQAEEDPAAWETEFYANPKQALAKEVEKLEHKMMTKQQQAAEDRRVWNDFVADHPELADFQDEITNIVMKEATLFSSVSRTRGEKAARDLAAQKMKAKLNMYAQAGKPKKELGKEKSVTPTTSQNSVTQKKGEEKPMTLKEQMAKLNSKRRGQ